MKPIETPQGRLWSARHALRLLCEARDQMERAGAPQSLARIRLAISWAESDVRYAESRAQSGEDE